MSSPQRQEQEQPLERAWDRYTAEVINATLRGFGIVRADDDWFRIRAQMDLMTQAKRQQMNSRTFPVLPLDQVTFPLGNKYKGQKISDIAKTSDGIQYLQWCMDNMDCLHLPDKFVQVREAILHYLKNAM